MNSKRQFQVINSFLFSKIGVIIELKDIEFGLASGTLLKSLSSGLYWQVKNRILESFADKRFENESEVKAHLSIPDINARIARQNTQMNSFLYMISPINHFTRPLKDEILVLHKTIAIEPMKIIEIYDDFLLLESRNNSTELLSKRKIQSNAQIADYVRHCEHGYHDLVDKDGNFIYRNRNAT